HHPGGGCAFADPGASQLCFHRREPSALAGFTGRFHWHGRARRWRTHGAGMVSPGRTRTWTPKGFAPACGASNRSRPGPGGRGSRRVSAITAEPIPAQDAPPRWQADLALAFVALLWGGTFVVVKSVLSDISTIYFLAIRFWVASLCMALLFIKPFRAAGAKAVWSGLRGGAVAGLFLWSGYILQTYGLKYTSAGKSGFITGLYIVLVPLIGASVYRKWPHISEIIGILIATAGMGLMLAPGESGFAFNMRQFRLDQFNFGDLLTIACAVAFAGQLVVLGYYARRERFEAVALGQILCAAVLSTVALSAEPPRVSWSPGVVFALALTGIFATAIAVAIQTWGQQYTSATRTALIFALEPVFALVTAVTFGGEWLTAGAVVGGLLILAGILLVVLKPVGRSQHPINSTS